MEGLVWHDISSVTTVPSAVSLSSLLKQSRQSENVLQIGCYVVCSSLCLHLRRHNILLFSVRLQ